MERREQGNTNEQKKREEARRIFDYLDPIITEAFDRKESGKYKQANIQDYAEQMDKLHKKALAEGMSRKQFEEECEKIKQEYADTDKTVNEVYGEPKSLSVQKIDQIVAMLKDLDHTGLESEIKKYFGIDGDSWFGTLVILNSLQEGGIDIWGLVRKKFGEAD